MQQEISRVTRPREAARKSYNRISRWYNLLSDRFERRPRDMGVHQLAVGDGETALEIGFGTGYSILAMARSTGLKGNVYGIDISDRMLQITRSRVRKAGLSEIVLLERGDAVQLPFRENFFDAIFMSFTLELFDTPDIPIVLGECHKILRNGGRICVVAMSKKGQASKALSLYEWAHRKYPRFCDCRPIFAQTALEEAGFHITHILDMRMWGLPIEIVSATKA
ncbi:MAG: methyltransferase domain-containing protein [Chloroflexota bacterium]|nr:methyltransferase domain-containing protein [Chloroflexota bacterium]